MDDLYLCTLLHAPGGGRQIVEAPLEAPVRFNGLSFLMGGTAHGDDAFSLGVRSPSPLTELLAVAAEPQSAFVVTALFNGAAPTSTSPPFALRYYVRPTLAAQQLAGYGFCVGEEALRAALTKHAAAVLVETPWVRALARRPALIVPAVFRGDRRPAVQDASLLGVSLGGAGAGAGAGLGLGAVAGVGAVAAVAGEEDDSIAHIARFVNLAIGRNAANQIAARSLPSAQAPMPSARSLPSAQALAPSAQAPVPSARSLPSAQALVPSLPSLPPAASTALVLPRGFGGGGGAAGSGSGGGAASNSANAAASLSRGPLHSLVSTRVASAAAAARMRLPVSLLADAPGGGRRWVYSSAAAARADSKEDDDLFDVEADADDGSLVSAQQAAAVRRMRAVEARCESVAAPFRIALATSSGGGSEGEDSDDDTGGDDDKGSLLWSPLPEATQHTQPTHWLPRCGVLQAPPGAGRRRALLLLCREVDEPALPDAVPVSTTLVVCATAGGVDAWVAEAALLGVRCLAIRTPREFARVRLCQLRAAGVVVLPLPLLADAEADAAAAARLAHATLTQSALFRPASTRLHPQHQQQHLQHQHPQPPLHLLHDRALRWLRRILPSRFPAAHVPWLSLAWQRIIVDDAQQCLSRGPADALAVLMRLRATWSWLAVKTLAATRMMPLNPPLLRAFAPLLGLPTAAEDGIAGGAGSGHSIIVEPHAVAAIHASRLVHLGYSASRAAAAHATTMVVTPSATEAALTAPPPAASLDAYGFPRPQRLPTEQALARVARASLGLVQGISYASLMRRSRPMSPDTARRLLAEHYAAEIAKASPCVPSAPGGGAAASATASAATSAAVGVSSGAGSAGEGDGDMLVLDLGPSAPTAPAIPPAPAAPPPPPRHPFLAALVHAPAPAPAPSAPEPAPIRRRAEFVARIMDEFAGGTPPTCPICGDEPALHVPVCGHAMCADCTAASRRATPRFDGTMPCPMCKLVLAPLDWFVIAGAEAPVGAPTTTAALAGAGAGAAATTATAATAAGTSAEELPAKLKRVLDLCCSDCPVGAYALVLLGTDELAAHAAAQMRPFWPAHVVEAPVSAEGVAAGMAVEGTGMADGSSKAAGGGEDRPKTRVTIASFTQFLRRRSIGAATPALIVLPSPLTAFRSANEGMPLELVYKAVLGAMLRFPAAPSAQASAHGPRVVVLFQAGTPEVEAAASGCALLERCLASCDGAQRDEDT